MRDYLTAVSPAAITEAVWQDLLLRLAPVSESYLRDLLRDTGLPFDQPYAGIRQHTFEELEQGLREMLQVYRDALAAGARERARYCRRQVIAAKDRAKFLVLDLSCQAIAAQKKRVAHVERKRSLEIHLDILVRPQRARDDVLWHKAGQRVFGNLAGGRHFPNEAVIERQLVQSGRDRRHAGAGAGGFPPRRFVVREIRRRR